MYSANINDQIEDRLDHWIKDIGDALDYRDPQRLKLPNVELATAFLELETHEHDAAVSLQSLIKHYDLCVKALRHTEGAGDAIAGGVEAHEHPLNASGSDEEVPMSADERVELVQVIQNDAKEVDAVVTEINDLSEAIQDKADRIEESAASHRSEASTLGGTARMLEALGVDLSKASQQSQSAFSTWAAELEVLQRRLPEMQAIDASFKKTLNAYGGLQRHLTKRRERRAQIEQLFAGENAHSPYPFISMSLGISYSRC